MTGTAALDAVLAEEGQLPEPWRDAFRSVDRAWFVPDQCWLDDEHGRIRPLDRTSDPDGWFAAVYANEPLVTQYDDGATAWPSTDGRTPTSSASQPSVVLAMLAAADIQPGQRVLEIGTGTGYSAALIAARGIAVTTIEVDDHLAAAAAARLAEHGYPVRVITGDGAAGDPETAPFDRIISTASVRAGTIPNAWLTQSRPDGLITTPWGSNYLNGQLALLTVHADGTATGRFGEPLRFMRLRAQRRYLYQPPAEEIERADRRDIHLGGHDIYRMITATEAGFAIGARLPECSLTVDYDIDHDGHHHVEIADPESRSWARLDADLAAGKLTAQQTGPRKLWDEAEAAYHWWHQHGEPGIDRFGLLVTPQEQRIWLDRPAGTVHMTLS
ncbi:methyltransferase domain-containing protein [Amycolatopsis sp. NPDC059021]|uniref:methyltransferase domain-containing protein n=1 Tax=Amycolatopsis sp. NPDC059021 TaxID=3346704 RepID=UPI003670AD2D